MPKQFFDQTLEVLSIEFNSINALFVNHFYNKQYILKFTIEVKRHQSICKFNGNLMYGCDKVVVRSLKAIKLILTIVSIISKT